MASELRITAILPMGDDQLANASTMHKLAPAVEAFRKAAAAVAAGAVVNVAVVKLKSSKLTTAQPMPTPEPPAELPLEQQMPPVLHVAAATSRAPWLAKQGEAA
jgi:hypothetical protein